MLKITIKGHEFWNSATEEFMTLPDTVLCLEHSLNSLSKWEAKWHRPFINDGPKTYDEFVDYIRCMTLNEEDVDPRIFSVLTQTNINEIEEYLKDPMSATWFGKDRNAAWQDTGSISSPQRPKKLREVVTAEVIYYWMVQLQIPFECDNWNLNRLFTLIRVCNEKNKPQKKMSKKQLMTRNTALNQLRKQQLNTTG